MIQIWTDGACSGNPGPGGWAFRLVSAEGILDQNGGEPHTTNNRMELVAVLRALQHCEEHDLRPVTIHTDSQNVIGWLSKGWKRNNPQVAEICAQIDPLKHRVTKWVYVRGHAGEPNNEAVDKLAVAAIPR